MQQSISPKVVIGIIAAVVGIAAVIALRVVMAPPAAPAAGTPNTGKAMNPYAERTGGQSPAGAPGNR